MTRIYVYSSALVASVAATAMVIASIIIPNWVSYTVTTPRGDRIERHVGLHKVCMNIETPNCKPYPTPKFCEAGEQAFCDMWRTVGFMASLSAIMCLASLVCFLVVMTGGKYKRETGWPFVSGMLTLVSFVDIAIISFVSYLFDYDDQFAIPGWNLGVSFYISLASGVLCLFTAGGLAVSAYLLPPEQGYDFLEDPVDA